MGSQECYHRFIFKSYSVYALRWGFERQTKKGLVFKNKESKFDVKPSDANHGFLQVTYLSLHQSKLQKR